jgi:hypothetical protein
MQMKNEEIITIKSNEKYFYNPRGPVYNAWRFFSDDVIKDYRRTTFLICHGVRNIENENSVRKFMMEIILSNTCMEFLERFGQFRSICSEVESQYKKIRSTIFDEYKKVQNLEDVEEFKEVGEGNSI